jgi:hypothetical protein
MRPTKAALKTKPNWFGAIMQRSRHHRRGYADRQKVESVEQRYQSAQHDDPDLQRPERTPVDQLGNINRRRY